MSKKLLLLIFGTITGVFFVEIGLRWLNYPYAGCKSIHEVSEYTTGQYDPGLGWRYKPATSTVLDGITYTFNAEGYRVEDVSKKTDVTKPIILIAGDSTLFGDGLAFTDTFGFKLQEKLNNRFEVLNFAVQGYGLDQIYLRLKEILPVYKPRYVIVDFIEDQDYRDAIQDRRSLFPCQKTSGTKPVFEVKNNALVLMHTPERFETYDNPRLRLVWRRLIDAIDQNSANKQELSKLLYEHITQYVQDQKATFFGINYQLPLRAYEQQQQSSILVASYSGEYVFADGFHPNTKGTTRLADDFLTQFASQLR